MGIGSGRETCSEWSASDYPPGQSWWEELCLIPQLCDVQHCWPATRIWWRSQRLLASQGDVIHSHLFSRLLGRKTHDFPISTGRLGEWHWHDFFFVCFLILTFCVCVLVTQLCLTLWDLMEFPRQEYWSPLPFPSLGDLPNPGIEPRSPEWQANSLPSELWGKPIIVK